MDTDFTQGNGAKRGRRPGLEREFLSGVTPVPYQHPDICDGVENRIPPEIKLGPDMLPIEIGPRGTTEFLHGMGLRFVRAPAAFLPDSFGG